MVLLFKTIIWFLAADLGCCVQALAICRGGCSLFAEGGALYLQRGDPL